MMAPEAFEAEAPALGLSELVRPAANDGIGGMPAAGAPLRCLRTSWHAQGQVQEPMAVQSEASFSSDGDNADDGERWQSDCRWVLADMDVPDGLSLSSASSSHPLNTVTVGKDQLPQPPEELGRDATSLPGHPRAEHRPGAGQLVQ